VRLFPLNKEAFLEKTFPLLNYLHQELNINNFEGKEMKIILFAVIGIVWIMVYKKPYFSAMLFSLIVSLSPLLKLYIGNTAYNFTILLTLCILIVKVLQDKLIKKSLIIYVSIVFIFIYLHFLILGSHPQQVILSIYRYLYIPIISYYSIIYMINNNIKISTVYTPYIIINLLILYYRAFIDYTFLGAMQYSEFFDGLFIMGSIFYRPSNLSAPIIFSIELVIYLCLLLFENKKVKLFFVMFLASLYPLILMQSRSSYILLLVFILVYLLIQKRFIIVSSIIFIITTLGLLFGNSIYLFSALNFQEKSYTVRISSMINTIENFLNESPFVILFGKGVGSSNMNLNDVEKNFGGIYVENFYLALLYDSGIVIFSIWIIFNILLLLKSLKIKSKISIYAFILILCLFLTNIFASNLTANVIQVLYWQLAFIILLRNRNINILNNID
jgi:hypothetical protein